MRTPKVILREYRELREQLPEIIENSGLKPQVIYGRMGMKKPTYYRRLANPEQWTLEELESLVKALEPQQLHG